MLRKSKQERERERKRASKVPIIPPACSSRSETSPPRTPGAEVEAHDLSLVLAPALLLALPLPLPLSPAGRRTRARSVYPSRYASAILRSSVMFKEGVGMSQVFLSLLSHFLKLHVFPVCTQRR